MDVIGKTSNNVRQHLHVWGPSVVDYDLFGWGESELQVTSAGHQSSISHIIQAK